MAGAPLKRPNSKAPAKPKQRAKAVTRQVADTLGFDSTDLMLPEWVPIEEKIKLESHRASMHLAKSMNRVSLWILIGILAGAFAVAFMNITEEHNDFAFHVITTITGGLIGYLYARSKGGSES